LAQGTSLVDAKTIVVGIRGVTMSLIEEKTAENLTTDEMSTENADELLSTLEHTWVKVKKCKIEGRRASVVASETDLMKIIDKLKTVMQGCLQSSNNKHELLVNIFGGDFLRISIASALLETIQYSKEYETGSHVREAVAECISVEKVLEDLGYQVELQKVKVGAYVDLLQRTGHASEEELSAAQAKKAAVLEAAEEEEARKKAAKAEEAKKKAAKEQEVKKKALEAEDRQKAEAEAKKAAAAAMKVKELPQLSHDKGLDLKAIHDRGIVEIVEHKVEEAPHPDPAPGVRFVVTNHAVEAGHHGTIVEPADDGQWKVRIDGGSFCVLSPDAFHTAPPPVASVTLKKRVDFVSVRHGEDVTPHYNEPAEAEAVLKNTAEILTIFEQVIVSVEGHTATPDAKMDAWAHSLAQARADKIKSVLVELGIEADRLKPIGLPGKFGSGHHDLVLKVVSL